ncbi:hypothetical protein niasHT_026985 [Heterodera trifolii]|uniref:Uncharacterized protein n=1 Tax=Heterodera trifolii TaxID=157864 RepID=A0ABD2KRQ6_9BILA
MSFSASVIIFPSLNFLLLVLGTLFVILSQCCGSSKKPKAGTVPTPQASAKGESPEEQFDDPSHSMDYPPMDGEPLHVLPTPKGKSPPPEKSCKGSSKGAMPPAASKDRAPQSEPNYGSLAGLEKEIADAIVNAPLVNGFLIATAQTAHQKKASAAVNGPPIATAQTAHQKKASAAVNGPPIATAQTAHPKKGRAAVNGPPIATAQTAHPKKGRAAVNGPLNATAQTAHPKKGRAAVNGPLNATAQTAHPKKASAAVDGPPNATAQGPQQK